MKFHLFCFVLAAALPLSAIGQESEPGPSPHIAAALNTVDAYDAKVAQLRREYYDQLAKMDAAYKAKANELRSSLVKDLVELQSQTARTNLDDAAQILDLARQFEKSATLSPYETDVAADRRIAVFLQIRPNSDIVERIHILAANGRSLVINADYQTQVQSGEWKFDGDMITYTEKYTPRRFDEKPGEINIPLRYDAGRNEYVFPESINQDIKLGSYINGSERLLLGNPQFLIPKQESGGTDEPSDEPKPE